VLGEVLEAAFTTVLQPLQRPYVIVRAMWEFSVNLIKRIARTLLTTRSVLPQKDKPAKVFIGPI
jgi:hypothetical protein